MTGVRPGDDKDHMNIGIETIVTVSRGKLPFRCNVDYQ